MRILVVDSSKLTPWLIARTAPEPADIMTATSFDFAEEMLSSHPPDAVVFSLSPGSIDWRRLIDLCVHRQPPIPFLCLSNLSSEEGYVADLPVRKEDTLIKHSDTRVLRERLEALFAAARRHEPLVPSRKQSAKPPPTQTPTTNRSR